MSGYLQVSAFLRNWRKCNITKRKSDELVNENIRFKEVLVIGPEGEQLGVMGRREALQAASDVSLDLFCVAPNGTPPVCKILDYGRFKFEAQKKAKEAKKHQHQVELKPLRLSPVIEKNDFDTKLKQARDFLAEGNKVKLDMRFKGRMMTRVEVGKKVMDEFVESVKDLASVDKAASMEGRTMSIVLNPLKKK